jgi:hypothetical protein
MEQEVRYENTAIESHFPAPHTINGAAKRAVRAALYLRVSTRADQRDDDTARHGQQFVNSDAGTH